MTDDGVVTRDGEVIGEYQEGVLELKPGFGKFNLPVQRLLKKNDVNIKRTINHDPPAKGRRKKKKAEPPLPQPEVLTATIQSGYETEDEVEMPSKGIPKPPPKDKLLGSKTPAYIEWMKKYHPKKYKKNYGKFLKKKSMRRGSGPGFGELPMHAGTMDEVQSRIMKQLEAER